MKKEIGGFVVDWNLIWLVGWDASKQEGGEKYGEGSRGWRRLLGR
jgi:hypothetical protein